MLLAITTFQLQAFVTVGDGNCDYVLIQKALDEGATELRVVNNKTYEENLILDDIDISISGGYQTCELAVQGVADGPNSVISGALNPAQPVISITGAQQQSIVSFDQLTLSDGSEGIYSNSADVTINVDDTVITGNTGSGLYCTGGSSLVSITGASEISQNIFDGSGGGLFVSNLCQVDVYSPVLISENEVSMGGGVYADQGAVVNLHGAVIENNQASAAGGGIYIADQGTVLTSTQSQVLGNLAVTDTNFGGGIFAIGGSNISFVGGLIQGNHSDFDGGGLYLATGAQVNLHGVSLQDNSALHHGGAFIASDAGTTLTLTQTSISQNEAPGNGVGDIIFGATVNVENSLIYQNMTTNESFGLFLLFGGDSNLNLNYVTITNNTIPASNEVISVNGSLISALSSIIHNEGHPVFNATNNPILNVNCAIVNEDQSFPADQTVMVTDPMFVDPSNDDYHLQANSPAIDYCADEVSLNVEYPGDIDGQLRGYDVPGVDNGGIYDLGADEYDNDLIFESGFEIN